MLLDMMRSIDLSKIDWVRFFAESITWNWVGGKPLGQ